MFRHAFPATCPVFCAEADNGAVFGLCAATSYRRKGKGVSEYYYEIEDLLATHPAVMEAHVFGVHDDRLGEDVCACIRLRKGFDLTERDVKEYGKGRIAHFKIPRYVHFTEEFPKTASGKIKKHLLREALEARGTVPTRPKFS